MQKELIKEDRNGTKYFKSICKCDKCGGTGTYVWGAVINGRPQYAGVCFKCDGAGVVSRVEKEYTPEHEEKLQAQREKRRLQRVAKYEAEEQKREEERKAREERQARIEAERAEQRAKSNYVGNVGEKIDLVLTLDFVAEYTFTDWYGRELTGEIYGLSDENGNRIITKCSLFVEGRDEFDKPERAYAYKGDVIKVTGKIKEHKEYKGEKQTVLQRVKVLEFIVKKEAE